MRKVVLNYRSGTSIVFDDLTPLHSNEIIRLLNGEEITYEGKVFAFDAADEHGTWLYKEYVDGERYVPRVPHPVETSGMIGRSRPPFKKVGKPKHTPVPESERGKWMDKHPLILLDRELGHEAD